MAPRTNKGEGLTAPSKKILPGTPELEAHLSAGYPEIGTRAKAEMILKERKENPLLWPYTMVEKAEAFLAALDATGQVISTKPGYKRTHRE
jgi:hypothetical protein